MLETLTGDLEILSDSVLRDVIRLPRLDADDDSKQPVYCSIGRRRYARRPEDVKTISEIVEN